MTCREASELHTHAAEGALTGMKKSLYALHMTICSHCKRYRSQLGTTVKALQNLPPEEPPPPGLVDLLASELEKKKKL
jgi:hypothetical protein